MKVKKLGALGEAPAADPISAIAKAAGDTMKSYASIVNSLFGQSQKRKQEEAKRDAERAKAYGLVESERQKVFQQDSLNTGLLFQGLFETRQAELKKTNPYLPLLVVGGVVLTGAVVYYATQSK